MKIDGIRHPLYPLYREMVLPGTPNVMAYASLHVSPERLSCCGCTVTWFYNFKCRWCGADYSKLIDPMTEEPTP